MGNCCSSCEASEGSEAKGEEKFMTELRPGCNKFLPKWRKKYGVTGRLRVEELKELVGKLEASVAVKTGEIQTQKRKKKWLEQACKRKANTVKKKKKKRGKKRPKYCLCEKKITRGWPRAGGGLIILQPSPGPPPQKQQQNKILHNLPLLDLKPHRYTRTCRRKG